MADPDPDEVKHEIEMGAEEFLGHALPGNPDERIRALQDRITYLHLSIKRVTQGLPAINSTTLPGDIDSELARLRKELDQAKNLLADFKAQQSGRN